MSALLPPKTVSHAKPEPQGRETIENIRQGIHAEQLSPAELRSDTFFNNKEEKILAAASEILWRALGRFVADNIDPPDVHLSKIRERIANI